jgi:hypothetical protein
MDGRRLVGAVRTAHVDVATQFAQVERAAVADRAAPLADLIGMMRALASAEETVLFSALRTAMSPETILAESCTTEHQDIADRLETLARSPQRAGFTPAFVALRQDVREHQQDELDTVIPLLIEALGEEGATELAAAFDRALASS